MKKKHKDVDRFTNWEKNREAEKAIDKNSTLSLAKESIIWKVKSLAMKGELLLWFMKKFLDTKLLETKLQITETC